MNRFICKYVVATVAFIFTCSCGSKGVTEYHEKSRDKVIDGPSLMVSLDDKLPPINSFAVPIMAGDTIIILDYRSTDLLLTAYDIYNDSTIGRFGKYGGGPGEIGSALLRFYNKFNKNLYIGNGSRGEIVSFYLPDAVSDSTYDAIDRLPIDFYAGINSTYPIDESTVMCTTFTDLSTRNSRLSKLNLNTGEINDIDSINPFGNTKVSIAVSEKDNLIFSVDKNHDMIRVLNLDGNLRRIVYGPDYDDNAEEYVYYFNGCEICGNKVASVYTGKDSEKYRNKIILTDLDGKYIKTLFFDSTVHGMQYHDKTGRLYLTTTGEPQIGYIELDKIPE